MQLAFTIYRTSTVGRALEETLVELEAAHEMKDDLCLKMLETFDTTICEKFKELPSTDTC